MEIKVRVFLNGEQVDRSEVEKLTIKSKTVDRIVNDVVDRMQMTDENDAGEV